MEILKIKTDKTTVIWGYFATLLSVASGLIVLPLMLRFLEPEEVAIYYLLMTIRGLVDLFDLGFSPQISRNLTYIFSGATSIRKEGFERGSGEVNYRLLCNLITVSKAIYRKISLIVCIFLSTIGTIYIYFVVKDYETLSSSSLLPLWCFFVLISSSNMYYFYYNAFMEGKGLIKISKKINVVARIANIGVVSICLLFGLKLWSMLIGNLICLIILVVCSKKAFYSEEMYEAFKKIELTHSEKSDVFYKIWYNSKKVAIVYFSGFVINRFNLFIAGLYLDLKIVASMGLMMQFTGLIQSLSENYYLVSQPEIVSLRVTGDNIKLITKFSSAVVVYLSLFIIGSFVLVLIVPFFIDFIKSNTTLPSASLMILYCIICLLERQHSTFAAFITTGNRIPYLESSVIIGILIVVFSYVVLRFSNFGLLGLIMVQGAIQLCYANWKWPYEAMKELKMSYPKFLLTGFRNISQSFIKMLKPND